MTTSVHQPEERAVAVWLFIVAAMVAVMVLVGGATRLTDSGLSITEWRPVTGAVPPLTDAGWAAEFAKYQRIPEYRHINAGMSLPEFKTIYWWEWGHRFLGRVIGLVFAIPLVVFAVRRQLPKRLAPALIALFFLGGLQGLVGWWMVSSGLSERVDVAPERLTAHLGLALILFCALIWTGLSALGGASPAKGRAGVAAGLLALTFVQILLGGLVAGNDAGRVHTDWPLMSGQLWPSDYAGPTLWSTLAHSPAAVQMHHRLGAYLLFAVAWVAALTTRGEDRRGLLHFAGLVTLQAALGVATLMNVAPLGLSLAHQAGALVLLASATVLLWRARPRSGESSVTTFTAAGQAA